MIIDGHTHIFPREVGENRERYCQKDPGFRKIYRNEKARIVGPESLIAEMDSAGMRAATMISARLGQLTSAQVPISATLSSDFITGTTQKEHLIIVGRPDDNPLIQKLALPVPLAERRLALTSQMPAVVKPGDTISYTLTVENTSAVTQSLAVEDRLPVEGKLLTCTGQWGRCIELKPGVVRWSIGSLTPGRQVSTTVKVHLSMLTPPVVSLPRASAERCPPRPRACIA